MKFRLTLLAMFVTFVSSSAMAVSIELIDYVKKAAHRIQQTWLAPKNSKKASVVCRIHKRGELSHLRIEKSSGKSTVDQAALKAVEKGEPFEDLPESSGDDIELRFVFDKNVSGEIIQSR